MRTTTGLSLVTITANVLLGAFLYKKTKEVEYYTKSLDRDVKRLEIHISDISESLKKAKLEINNSNTEIINSLESLYGKKRSNNYRNYNK